MLNKCYYFFNTNNCLCCLLDESSTSDVLLYVTVSTISSSDCKSYYEDKYFNNQEICTDPKAGANNPCTGDAGAPLLSLETDRINVQNYYLVGILNFFNGYQCDFNYPAVYTQITCDDDLKWINEVVDDDNNLTCNQINYNYLLY